MHAAFGIPDRQDSHADRLLVGRRGATPTGADFVRSWVIDAVAASVRVVAVLTALAMASSALSPRRSRTANNDQRSLTGSYGVGTVTVALFESEVPPMGAWQSETFHRPAWIV